jgi:hypothetical protein
VDRYVGGYRDASHVDRISRGNNAGEPEVRRSVGVCKSARSVESMREAAWLDRRPLRVQEGSGNPRAVAVVDEGSLAVAAEAHSCGYEGSEGGGRDAQRMDFLGLLCKHTGYVRNQEAIQLRQAYDLASNSSLSDSRQIAGVMPASRHWQTHCLGDDKGCGGCSQVVRSPDDYSNGQGHLHGSSWNHMMAALS